MPGVKKQEAVSNFLALLPADHNRFHMDIAIRFEAKNVDPPICTGVLILLSNGFDKLFDFDFTGLACACLAGNIEALVAIESLEKTHGKGA